MKTIYITEAQKKKIKKAIAAQDQVGGKVNAGVMDAVAYGGGMCENVEDDEYKLGAEKGMSPYYHVTEAVEPNRMVDVHQLIRSDKFKAWFGDWENDPQNASKAVDKNGFPLVVHHGSPKFVGDKFDKEKIGHSINHGEGDIFCTTQDMSLAKRFSYPATQGTFSFTIKPDYSKPGDILSGFLNLRHPLDFFHLTDEDWKNIKNMIKDTYFGDLADREGYMDNQKEVIEKYINHQLVKGNIAGAIKMQFGTFGKQLKRYGYDGLIADMGAKDGAIEYCFLEPNQFKSIYALSFNSNSESIYESKNYDMSEIGAVNCQLNFDEDEYIEWLNDNELQDIPEVKTQFIKDYCTYSIEYLTAETFHSFDYDDLTYDEVIDTFGENMGMAMINDCMDGKEHSFETLEYVEDTPVDLTNPKEVNAAAKKYMRSVDHPAGQFRGFILTDGTVVDAGWDHIACTRIPGVKSREHFVQLGNIRFSNTGLEFAKYPTHEQLRMLRIYCEYHQSDTIYVDIVNEKIGRGDFTYNGIDFQELVNDLYNYFTHGIKNHRNDLHESLDELDLYHGTNADFDKFDEKFYLSGIGEMAYGWGVYLTNSINTAKEYGPGGQIMTVEVPDGKYLDSRKISKAEASKLARAFYKFYLSGKGKELYKGSEKEFWEYECSCLEKVPDGSYLYGTVSTFLGSDKEASEWLHSMGYVGLRFPGHNQVTGEKFMNYVIFDANDVKIIKKEKNELHESIENYVITLYHGVREKDLEYNIEKGGFYPRVCSEGGPKAIWLSEKQYGYPFIFKFEIPRNAVEQVSNVDYIYTQPISFNDFSCELVRTQIYAYPVRDTAVEVNICDERMSKIHFRYFPNLGMTLWKMFKNYPHVLDTYINPYIEKYQTLSESKKKVVKNDEGEIVPETCDKCGGKVVVQIHGEPVYVCKDCGKYFGTVPFTLDESKLNESFTDCEEFYEDHTEFDLLSEFTCDKENNIKQKKWNLIPAEQYHTLLKRYMNDPTMARIPYNVVHNWFTNIIIPNALDIYYITNLAGHSSYFPSDVVSDYFDADNIVDYKTGSEYLESIGFYDWCKLPDGTDAWSDYGLNPLFQNIHEYTPNMSAEDLLILINRCLDVVHQRGDLSSAFIQGGKKSCDYISNGIRENIESEIVNPEDVDLSSFNIKKNLNPKFWKNGVLDSRIRMKLLDIADDFIEFLGVEWAKPEDITMTGSLANFNWSENYSDIDLHIIMDYSDVDERTDFVSNYFYSQKKLWNEEHSDITIMGFPVEVFVQDVNERHDSSGVYSLEKNKWLIEPEREKLASSKVNKSFIKDKVSDYMNKIDKLEYLFNKAKDDEYRLRRVMEKSDKLFDKIKGERKLGFERSGGKEINNYNIVFKALRRNGYIEKLVNIKSMAYDKLNSLR